MGWLHRPTGRSVCCNGEAIKYHRSRRGWTQRELASLSRFSVRVIAKAEAGEPVHPDTLEVLSETLSTETHPVYPEDLVASPKDIARHIIECYARHERQCAAHCSAFLAEDLTTAAPGDPSLLPFAGVHESIDGFDHFWKAFFSVMERQHKRLILDEMRIVAEANQVVILTKEWTSFCGEQLDATGIPIGFVMEFERGKLKRLEDHFDAGYVHSIVRDFVARSDSAAARLRQATEKH